MRLEDANDLLKPGYLPLESGYVRLENGQMHVACWTTMPGCKGRMVEWWLAYPKTTEDYKRWHPTDHVWSDWVVEQETGHVAGSTHLAHEYVGGELQKLKISSREPSEYFDVKRLEAAGIASVACARTGPIDAPVWVGHLIHLCRDTAYGCEMRSRFWIGDFDPPDIAPDPETRRRLISDSVGPAVLQHCHEEMTILAGFLPELYAQHNP
jgi:DAPG hydrolase PhiG domain